MVVYNLDENPDVFIAPRYYNDEFAYIMILIKGEDDRKIINSIDLRSDKLVVYGLEMKETMFKRLQESLILRPKKGHFYVNCNGACYILAGGNRYRPIYNVIFDWSSFGVIVPNSVNDLLKKRVGELEKVVEKSNKEVELARVQVECRNNEINELKKVQHELGLEVQKAYEKVSLIDFELELYKIELESCKKESDDVLDELCDCKGEKTKMKLELQEIHDQHLFEILNVNKRGDDMELKSKLLENELISVNSALQSTKDQLELSNKNAKELEELLSKTNQELSSIRLELHSTKGQLASSNVNAKEVEEQLCTANKELSSIQSELQTTRGQLLSDISTFSKKNHDLEMISKTLENQLSLTQSELLSNKNQLDSSDKNIKKLEEQLSSFKNKCEDTMTLLEASRKEIEELKDQIELHDKEKCLMHKMWSNCFSIFDKRN